MSFYLNGYKKRLSCPIFIDNVVCNGSETKLIECSYHTHTNEDKHSEDVWVKCEDVWVKCGAKNNSIDCLQDDVNQKSDSSTVALTVVLGACLLVITVGVVYTLVKYLRKQRFSMSDK